MRKITLSVGLFVFLFTAFSLTAQDANSLPTSQGVEVTTPDSITLVGDFYPVSDSITELPTLILLYGQGSTPRMDALDRPGNRRRWLQNQHELWFGTIRAFLEKALISYQSVSAPIPRRESKSHLRKMAARKTTGRCLWGKSSLYRCRFQRYRPPAAAH